jgi:hypothetical protein
MYHVTDLLHAGHSVDVPGQDIAPTLSTWLAELGVADTPLVEELARAVCAGDWPTTHAISDRLSVDITGAPVSTPTAGGGYAPHPEA